MRLRRIEGRGDGTRHALVVFEDLAGRLEEVHGPVFPLDAVLERRDRQELNWPPPEEGHGDVGREELPFRRATWGRGREEGLRGRSLASDAGVYGASEWVPT